jgi:hypothetical protein
LALLAGPGDAHPRSRLPYRAFEHVADANFAADLLHIDCPALVRKTGIAGNYEEPVDAGQRGDYFLDHAVAKYSCSGSPLILAKGNTAIEGLSGNGSAREGWEAYFAPPAMRTRHTCSGRAMFLSVCSPKSSKATSGFSLLHARKNQFGSCSREQLQVTSQRPYGADIIVPQGIT